MINSSNHNNIQKYKEKTFKMNPYNKCTYANPKGVENMDTYKNVE